MERQQHRISQRPRYAIERDIVNGQPLFTIPVAGPKVDYEELYRLSETEFLTLLDDPAAAAAFAQCCGRREMDDRLVLPPPAARGVYGG